MRQQRFKCAHCSENIVKSFDNGTVKVWSKILIFQNGRCFAKCINCKELTQIPVVLGGKFCSEKLVVPKDKK